MKMHDFNFTEPVTLKRIGSWPETAHQFQQEQVLAAVAAYHAERALLIKGEPGVGKSQLARAIAQTLGWQFIDINIQPHTEYQDLLWEFDAVGRLSQAQLLSASGYRPKDSDDIQMPPHLALENYIVPGPLWWAVRPVSAEETVKNSLAANRPCPERVKNPEKPGQVVVLIDEIDKADANLPNGLLEILGNKDISLPVNCFTEDETTRLPLTMITSNDERELPPAFLRRCFTLNITLPEAPDQLENYLVEWAMVHKTRGIDSIARVPETIIRKAATQMVKIRENLPQGIRRPSPAEYLDMLRAIGGMSATESMEKLLYDLSDIVFRKGELNP